MDAMPAPLFCNDLPFIFIVSVPGNSQRLDDFQIRHRTAKGFCHLSDLLFHLYGFLRREGAALFSTDLFSGKACRFDSFLRPLVQIFHFLFRLGKSKPDLFLRQGKKVLIDRFGDIGEELIRFPVSGVG